MSASKCFKCGTWQVHKSIDNKTSCNSVTPLSWQDLCAFEIFSGTSGIYSSFRRILMCLSVCYVHRLVFTLLITNSPSQPPLFWGRRGMTAARYDVDLDPSSMDFCSLFFVGRRNWMLANNRIVWNAKSLSLIRLGLLVACQYLLRMAPGSLLYSGLPCSLHVWMSRGTSGKSRDNPRGNVSQNAVRIANLIASRFAMLLLVCCVRQIWHLTEQPASSVAKYLPYLELALHPDRMMLGFQPGLCQNLYPAFINSVCVLVLNVQCGSIWSHICSNINGSTFNHEFHELSWMGLFGHRSLKRSMLFGSACLGSYYRMIVESNRSIDGLEIILEWSTSLTVQKAQVLGTHDVATSPDYSAWPGEAQLVF